jgi:prolyl oligopeptidase
VDVNAMAADATVALDWWYPSEDGRYVAYGTSPGGSEVSTLAVVDASTGRLRPDAVFTGRAGSVAWLPDGSGFYYSRYPKKGEVPAGQEAYNRRIWFHRLGDAQAKARVRRRARPARLAQRLALQGRPLAARRGRPGLDEVGGLPEGPAGSRAQFGHGEGGRERRGARRIWTPGEGERH